MKTNRKSKRLLSPHDISTHFIHTTALAWDWKGWWIFRWYESRHTVDSVTEALADAGFIKILRRNIHGKVSQAWLLKEPSRDEIEHLILGHRKAWVYKHRPSSVKLKEWRTL